MPKPIDFCDQMGIKPIGKKIQGYGRLVELSYDLQEAFDSDGLGPRSVIATFNSSAGETHWQVKDAALFSILAQRLAEAVELYLLFKSDDFCAPSNLWIEKKNGQWIVDEG